MGRRVVLGSRDTVIVGTVEEVYRELPTYVCSHIMKRGGSSSSVIIIK